MRPLAYFLMVLCAAAALRAQDATTLAVRESELNKRAVEGLHAIADAFQNEKQHARALPLRREIWMHYDEDDKVARAKTGFVQVGSLWRKDNNAVVIDRDLNGKRSKIRRVEREWEKLAKELCDEHRALAEGWTKIGERDKALPHWRRVLRFLPGDEAAANELAIREFEGFTGTADELQMLRRGRSIEGAVDWLNRYPFPVEVLDGERFDLLEKAGLTCNGVRSEYFTVWGTLPVDDLTTIARDCERALLLAYTLFGVHGGEAFAPRRHRDMVFTVDKAQYAAAMDVCKGQFTADRFRFLRDDVDQCFVYHGGTEWRLHTMNGDMALARDQAVRGVMQDATGVVTDGLWEGIGHAACGFLFGRTLTFLLEQQSERTAASFTPTALAPDLDVWMQIAQESAWAKSDTRTSELVLLKAARFTTEQRVKAWAMCHYLLHWRPDYVLELEASKTPAANTPPDVEAEFLRRTKYELPKIDADWRTFWGRGDALREAMARDPLPAEKEPSRAAIERMRDVVDVVNEQRAAWRVGPIGYYLDAGPDFLATRRYEKALQKAQKEQQKRDKLREKGKQVEPVVMPAPPHAVGRTVLFSQADDAIACVRGWLARPDLRDKLLHPGRELLAVPSDAGAYLLGVALPAIATTRGAPLAWPRDKQRAIPGSVAFDALDARARAALAQQGKAAGDTVGMPCTLHFCRAIAENLMQGVQCRAYDNERAVAGVLVRYGRGVDGDDPKDGEEKDGGAEGADAEPQPPQELPFADGCVAFVPLEPLRKGARIELRWVVPSTLLARDQRVGPVVFTVE